MTDLVAFDTDGTRIAIVAPALNRLAEDNSTQFGHASLA